MIIPMKRVALLCLEQDKTSALKELRKLGVMQLIPSAVPPETEDVTSLSHAAADAAKAAGIILSAEAPDRFRSPASSAKTGAEAVEKALALDSELTALTRELDQLERDHALLAPWGAFDPASLDELREKGVFVTLCMCSSSAYAEREKNGGEETFPADAVREIIARGKTAVCYVLISTERDHAEDPHAVRLPALPLRKNEERTACVRDRIRAIRRELVSLKSMLDEVESCRANAESALEFAEARDGMEASGPLCWISGYVPETALEELRMAALRCGWALEITDPADDEAVPTYIRKARFLNIMDPLFDFIGVQPGYHESDVNAFFLLFFPIFFGMIIGDAGYGVIFLLSAFAARCFLRGKPAARQAINLFTLLSCSSLIWGALNGAWFGIPRDVLPAFMRGINFLADPQNSPFACRLAEQLNLIRPEMTEAERSAVYGGLTDKFVQYFCFLLAAFHLGSARIFKFFDEIPQTWRAVSHLGWACLIVANFFMAVDLIVFNGTFPGFIGYPLYGIGFVLIVITTSGVGFLNLPFSLINSFVDVLSYIRLFAVGLAGTYIAVNFNRMGTMVLHALPENCFLLGVLLLAVIALFGHVLNIALGFLSVMVHGIRLNTLEFSNHAGMQWAGIRFRPFAEPETLHTNKQS